MKFWSQFILNSLQTVRTPLCVDPSCVIRDDKMYYARAEPYYPPVPPRTITANGMSEEGIRSAIESFKLLSLLVELRLYFKEMICENRSKRAFLTMQPFCFPYRFHL